MSEDIGNGLTIALYRRCVSCRINGKISNARIN